LLDADVATIYGIETKRVNEAVKNNLDKFPPSYMLVLSDAEFADLRSKFSTAKSAMTRVAPEAFTEKGYIVLDIPVNVTADSGNVTGIPASVTEGRCCAFRFYASVLFRLFSFLGIGLFFNSLAPARPPEAPPAWLCLA
jgi:hypothetical protein